MTRSLLRPLTALATLLLASSAAAAEWHDVHEAASPSLRGASPRVAAEAYLATATSKLRLDGVTLAFREELAGSAFRTVRFGQTHAGLPVLGSAAAVRLTPEGGVQLSVLEVARGLSVSPTPAVDQASAIAAAEAALGETLTQEPVLTLAVMPQRGTPGRLVWLVDALQGTARATRLYVDAHTGDFIRRQSLVHDALGRVYAESSVQNNYQTTDVTLGSLVASSPQRLTGWNSNFVVTNYSSGDAQGGFNVTQTLGPNSGADFLYSPPGDPLDIGDGFAQVMLYHHMTRAKDFFTSSLGVNMSSASWKVTAVANAVDGQYYMDNAFFSQAGIQGTYSAPNLIAIGQGSQVDFAVDSDVFVHEFGHYVSHNAVGYNGGQGAQNQYGLTPWGGGIDEGIADYFACTMNENPVLGEASLAPFGAERDLTDTGKRCPDDTVGEVHEDGEIIGSLGWSVRESFGKERGDQLVWGAVSLLTPNPSMTDFARGLQATADALVSQGQMTADERATLDGLIGARGMDDCDHVLDVSAQKPRTFVNMGLSFLGQLFGGYSCAALKGQLSLHSFYHLKVAPNPGDQSVKFVVDIQPQGGGELDWGIYVKAGDTVAMDPSSLFPMDAAWKVEHITGTHGEIVIDAASVPAFDPAQTYYMVIGDQNCPASRVTVTTETQGPTPPPTGAGGGGGTGGGSGAGGPGEGGGSNDDDDDDGGGRDNTACACSAAGSGSSAPWGALAGVGLAAAAVVARRRRR